MKKSLKETIKELEEKKKYEKGLSEEVFIKILFFQHERLVHLIVTFLTAVSAILFLLGYLFLDNIYLFVLFGITLVLFIFYIIHYYTLENGTQKLYELYFKIRKEEK